MNTICEKYLSNMKKYHELENHILLSDSSDQELLSTLSEIANKKRSIQKEQDSILVSYLIPFENGSNPITPEAVNELNEFAQKLAKSSKNVDSAISYRIHLILLDYYQKQGDFNQFMEHLYGCGLCEWYANHSNRKYRKCWHFTEVWKYLDKYEKLSETGRSFMERCLSNHLLNFTNLEPERLFAEGERIIQTFDDIEATYGSMASDSKQLRSAVYRNMLTAAEYFRHHEDSATPENTEKLYLYSQLALDEIHSTKDRDVSLLAQYPGYYYAAFHAGKIDLDTLLESLEQIMTPDPNLSRRANCLRIYNNTSGYVKYLTIYSQKPKEEIDQIVHDKIVAVMQYTELLKKDEETAFVNRYLFNFIHSAFLGLSTKEALRIMIQVTICQHKPTSIHTWVVCKLCEVILDFVIKYCPEQLAGVNGYSADEITSHRDELIRLMKFGAILHDIGKYNCFEVISNSSRKLEDLEFEHIKQHPYQGYLIIQNANLPQTVIDCITHHHIWHNGQGGYPLDLSPTGNQPLVDILSIADTLDAATDWFGRSYAIPKSVSALIDEFNLERDTRYAGFTIDVIYRPECIHQLNHVLMTERRNITCKVWRDIGGSNVSEDIIQELFPSNEN